MIDLHFIYIPLTWPSTCRFESMRLDLREEKAEEKGGTAEAITPASPPDSSSCSMIILSAIVYQVLDELDMVYNIYIQVLLKNLNGE